MSELTSEEFLKNIGNRPLTDEESKQLHLLLVKEGKSSSLADFLSELEKELKED